MAIKNIIVLGIGKVGTLVATLLQETGFNVTGVDNNISNITDFKIIKADINDKALLKKLFKSYDAVVSCLPYYHNKLVIEAAFDENLHYFDLTEDVPSMELIKEICSTNKKNPKLSITPLLMAPQCGLAPGFISIVAANLARSFKEIHMIEMRVGALPQHPKGSLGYAINWSAEGLVNQYLNDCTIIKDGEIKTVPAMQDSEKLIINGKNFEAFTTSGGVGTMCESFLGKTRELNYKTIRYMGHLKLMNFFFNELLMRYDRAKAGEILVNAKPPVDDDIVYVYSAVTGIKHHENYTSRAEFVKAYYPKIIHNKTWRAISWTTACSICAVIELAASNKLNAHGFIKQEDILLEDFFATKNGNYYIA